jgi:capsid protein
MKLLNRIKLGASVLFRGINPVARYEAAFGSPNRSTVPGLVQDAKFDVSAATREELVRKARYYEKNNGLVNRLADLFEQYVVGPGILFIPASSSAVWNESAAAYWRNWQRFSDLTSRASFGTLQGLLARSWFIDGEVFILKAQGGTGRPRVQVIEAHRVKTPKFTIDGIQNPSPTSNATIIDGVEIDANGRPIAYWIETIDNARKSTFKRVDADFIIHVFEPGRAGQYRGIPFITAVLNDIIDLDDLQVFEMQAAKEAASVTNVIKTKAGEVSDEDLQKGLTVSAITTEQKLAYYKERMRSEAVVLQHDDEFNQFRSDRPSVATSGYWDYLTAKICAGVGIPKEIVIPSSMQGTSMRSVLDIAAAFFRQRSSALQDSLGQVYEWVIESGLALNDPFLITGKPLDWYAWKARAPRSVSVDIGYSSSARVNEFKLGMTTLEDVYAELGQDWRERLRQKADEIAYADQLARERKIDRAEVMTLDPNELSSMAAAGAGNTPNP